MSKFLLVLLFFFSTLQSYSQSESPYELDWTKDGTWLGVSLGLNVLGFSLIQNKEALTEEELRSLSKEDIFFIDRWAAGNYSEAADKLSYIPFYGSFAMPLLMMLNKNQRSHAGQIFVLFIESMATTGALYTISAGAIERSRPLVYNDDLPLDLRLESGAQRSFFGGHTAATAAATFFAAKIFNDISDIEWAKPYVWAAAAAIPAWVAYLRLVSGKHFLTDNLLGYAVGALSGILIPELHKKENSNLNISPSFGYHYKGIGLTYNF